MCGIAGFTRDPGRSAAQNEAHVREMLAAIAHRGPDESGIHVEGGIAFGHLRLSIVDLAGGHQPRICPDTGDTLIFNGEIYGYGALAQDLVRSGVRLRDRSDTEVLFHLLQRDGIDATLERIDGMFAFAFFEGRSRTLHLARDRFGEKPLYYMQRNGVFAFGSEPRAVLAHPSLRDSALDIGSVAAFLAFEYLPGGRSLRDGLRKLLPGHALIHRDGVVTLRRYWRPSPSEPGEVSEVAESDRIDRLDDLLDTIVRDRLVADVPVGVFLSGGIDSSLIAALVAKHAPGLTALTVSMPHESYDETPAAQALARALGLDHTLIHLDEKNLLEAFHAVSAKMDEPLADASLLPTYALCRATRPLVKVALGGDGADELFAGYISFKANRAAPLMAAIPALAGRALRMLLNAIPHGASYMSADFLVRQLSHGFGLPPAQQWIACMAPFASDETARLWRPEALAQIRANASSEIADFFGGSRWSSAELMRRFILTYLPEDILQKVDRASMYNGLEVRAPFLGRAFAEYAMSLPSRDKIRGLTTKYLFKKLALRHVPAPIVSRPKHGFALPLGRLLRGVLKEPVGESLLGPGTMLSPFFQNREIERLWTEHQSGRLDHRKKLWTLYCLATAIRNTAAGP